MEGVGDTRSPHARPGGGKTDRRQKKAFCPVGGDALNAHVISQCERPPGGACAEAGGRIVTQGSRIIRWAKSSLDQTCAAPPSTNSSIPVTKADSSEARNNAALAISSTSAILPSGTEE